MIEAHIFAVGIEHAILAFEYSKHIIPRVVLTKLVGSVTPRPDGKTWIILSDFGYEVGSESSCDVVNVPIGFPTDFASIPRPLWATFPRWGKYGNAAVIHDWLYWDQASNPRITLEFLKEQENLLGPWQYRQEYLCEFVDTEEQFFSTELIEAALCTELEPLWN